jgi:ornithine cyclodeaminase/alanine dehydrogenase-like protein (mu-crystallin family)
MYLVPERVARELVTVQEAIALVETAFRAHEAGRSRVFPISGGLAHNNAGRFGAKLGVDGERGLSGLKVGSYWPSNRQRGQASHGSTTLLLDNSTGFPAAIVAASHLTALRTAAADAVGVKYLSRPDATILAVIGAGHQAFFDVLAVCSVRHISEIRVASRTLQSANSLCARLAAAGVTARAMEPRRAVPGADIVITATSATAAVIDDDWIGPGVHISAMGTDGPGKQELPVALVERGTLFADVREQSCVIGEFQHAVTLGLIRSEAITLLGSVLNATANGRQSSTEVTIFDSSGTALQDLAIAALALERAVARSVALQIDF